VRIAVARSTSIEGRAMTPRESFEEASRQFMQALQDAWAPSDIQQRGSFAESQYAQAVQQASLSEAFLRVAQAHASCMQVVQEALQRQGIPARASEAFRIYLRELRALWAEVDVDAIDAPALAAIGQSMVGVASMAAATDGDAMLRMPEARI